MKKTLSVLVVSLLCMSVFAEFIISPSAGFSNLYSTEESTDGLGLQTSSRNTLSWTPFSFGVSLGAVTQSGFTFLASSDFLTGGTMKFNHKYTRGPSPLPPAIDGSVKLSGLCVQGNLLFGYTYRKIPNLFLTFASGLSAGGGISKITEISTSGTTVSGLDIELRKADIGIPLYLGASYFFTQNIGVNLGILNTLGAGWVWYDTRGLPSALPYLGTGSDIIEPGFTNVFTLKLGPIFKL
ncbi:DUF2715 domain-containing protein [Treponema sp. HNW]|uniref:DUF2715 domain-containing protein n=1 Tax=Treponema sp. HNW TaxID=3116654 RepID=UPI003D0D5CE1